MRLSRSHRSSLQVIVMVLMAAVLGVLADRLYLRPSQEPLSIDSVYAENAHFTEMYSRSHPMATPDSAWTTTAADDVSPHDAADFEEDDVGRLVETFNFDPNTATAEQLLRLGLATWQVRAMLRYRAKGGRYHRREDFKRVPGMAPEVYERLEHHITIARAFRLYDDIEPRDTANRHRHATVDNNRPTTVDSFAVRSQKPQKFREMVVLDINSVDTTTLMRVPGIGSYRARRLVEYRSRLGGYVSIDQLDEIGDFPSELKEWFAVESAFSAPININGDDVRTMARHPYLTYAQARAIERYRHNYGDIKSLEELQLLEAFTADDLKRLEPYIHF